MRISKRSIARVQSRKDDSYNFGRYIPNPPVHLITNV